MKGFKKSMADLSQISISGVLYDLKDNAARISIATVSSNLSTEIERAKAGEATVQTNLTTEINRATLAEATISANLATESTTRATKDTELETRIENLEARGRFLSSWDIQTGLPSDYPSIPSSATTTYTYNYKVGDYYIVTNADGATTKKQPTGASITATKSGDTWTWEVGSAAETREVGNGDYYICSTISGTTATWVLVSNSQKTVNFSQIAGSPWDNTALATTLTAINTSISANATSISALETAKADKATTIAGISIGANIATIDLQDALGLEDLAYADSASGTFTPAGSIADISYTPAGTVTLTGFGTSTAEATLTREDYTPAGSISGYVIAAGDISVTLTQTATTVNSTGSFTPVGKVKVGTAENGNVLTGATIEVTIKDADTATAVTDITYEEYTPAGSISVATSISALTKAEFKADASNGIAIEGTNSAPTVTLTSSTVKIVNEVLTPGTTPTFSEGAFTAATIADGFFTANSPATWTGATYTAPALTDASVSAFNTDAVKTKVTGEVLEFISAATANAVTDRGTFTAGNVGFGTFNGGTAATVDLSKFNGGSKAADTFTAGAMPTFASSTFANVTDAEAAAPIFTGSKYTIGITKDDAMKSANFEGTAAAIKMTGAKYLKQEIDQHNFHGVTAAMSFAGTAGDVSVSGSYDKASVDTHTFTGSSVAVNATFSGTKAENLKVTKVEYDKTTTGSATFAGTATVLKTTFTGTAGTVTVTVS